MNTNKRYGNLGGPARIVGSALLVLAASLTWCQAREYCVRVDVPWAFALPDGSVHPPGTLRLCLDRDFTPVSGLHEVYVDNAPQLLLLSRSRKSESRSTERPVIVFERRPQGPLQLVGYASAGKNARVHRLYTPGKRSRDRVARPLFQLPPVTDQNLVALAARQE